MTRWEFLQLLIDRRGYRSYLEIGAQKGKTFNRIHCPVKVGVDPVGAAATYRGTSDDYFADPVWQQSFDLVFVDGLHEYGQVLRDVYHSLAVLNPGGLVVMHDCNPVLERRQVQPSPGFGGWNGDTWKAFVDLRQRVNLDCACGDFDQGMGVVIPRINTAVLVGATPLTWPELVAHRQEWLRLMPPEKLIEWIG